VNSSPCTICGERFGGVEVAFGEDPEHADAGAFAGRLHEQRQAERARGVAQ
jgi:hypothetical protein